jgi:vacuolar iron transporter family protein
MSDRKEIRRYLTNLDEERNAASLYRAMAESEKNPKLAEVYRKLAVTEDAHAELWASRLRDAGAAVPPFRTSLRTRIYLWATRRFGTRAVASSLASIEDAASGGYAAQPDAAAMIPEERSHARVLRQIGRGGMEGGELARIEGRHRSAGGNALRAAVLGANDGLLSNMSLVMGVAGAQLPGTSVLITGLSGLLAGAFSMALGEWISVQSSRELYERQIQTEKEEIENAPEEEAMELSLIYQARGLPEDQARQLAARIMTDREHALDTLAREELGIDPEELGGSAWEAAFASFFLFAAGAVVPVIPFTFLSGAAAIAASAAFSAVALFLMGAAITLFTGRSVLVSGARQLLFGLVAAGVTFLVGHLLGVTIAG